MKYTLVIKADELEERDELCQMIKVGSYSSALQDLDNYLRGRLKYEELTEPVDEALQLVRDKLHEICGEHDIKVWS